LSTSGTSSTITFIANRTYYTPIFVPSGLSIDRISCLTNSTFSGTATVRLGIYADTAGKPSTLILDAGTVSATAASTAYTITTSATISTGGIYWLAFNTQTAATTNSFFGVTTPALNGVVSIGVATSVYAGYYEASITGAFVDVVTTTLSGTNPIVFLRRA
jgi:hypothetical protein